MKPTRHVTMVVLLAALAAGGCSKRGEPSPAKEAPAETPKAVPVATAGEAPVSKPADDEGVGTAAPVTITEPTFADGKAAYDAKKYSDAAAIFERYTERRPENGWGQYMLGLSAWKSGDPDKAERAFGKALSIDPHHVKSLVNLSRVLIEQKRHEPALDRLSRAAEIDPGSAEVQQLLGITCHALGRIDDAAAAYRRAIELNEVQRGR